MPWLADALTDVNSSLTSNVENLDSHTFMPERLVPPAAVIMLGSPLLADGQVYGDLLARFEIILVPMTGANETMTDDLITMVESVVAGLIEDDYSIEQVGQPYMLTSNNANYLAANVSVVGVVRPTKGQP